MRISIFLFFLFTVCNNLIFAETIVLNSGEEIQGKIVEKTDAYIRISDPSGFLTKHDSSDIKDIIDDAPVFIEETEPISAAEPISDPVRQELSDNLKKTESMIQDTLKALYPAPKKRSGNQEKESDKSSLQEEIDRKYKGYDKFY
tara:strand:- start:550 stop:984 length:435 start_codon:yes stop_codon:yes gene_type:complete